MAICNEKNEKVSKVLDPTSTRSAPESLRGMCKIKAPESGFTATLRQIINQSLSHFFLREKHLCYVLVKHTVRKKVRISTFFYRNFAFVRNLL